MASATTRLISHDHKFSVDLRDLKGVKHQILDRWKAPVIVGDKKTFVTTGKVNLKAGEQFVLVAKSLKADNRSISAEIKVIHRDGTEHLMERFGLNAEKQVEISTIPTLKGRASLKFEQNPLSITLLFTQVSFVGLTDQPVVSDLQVDDSEIVGEVESSARIVNPLPDLPQYQFVFNILL